LRLVEKRAAGRFGLGALGAAMVGNPAVGAMVEHHSLLYADLHDPVRLLRREHRATELSQYWAYAAAEQPAGLPEARSVDYSNLMGNSSPLVADELLDAYPLHKHRSLLDVGGGDGSFLIAATKRYAHLQAMLFDLPPVATRATRRFSSLGIEDRARAFGGDFLKDQLPDGADVISLIRVVHDHNDTAASGLLASAYRALPSKGVLLLAEPMMGTPGAETVGDAYFGFYLLAMGSGRARSPQLLRQMLTAAGFSSAQLVRTRQPLQSRLIVARKDEIGKLS
jgi:demethylspheroidene O-methyltransferase